VSIGITSSVFSLFTDDSSAFSYHCVIQKKNIHIVNNMTWLVIFNNHLFLTEQIYRAAV